MIVCHCNVLTREQVLETLRNEPPHAPRSPVEAYRCLGCSPDCGRCIPTVRAILREARAFEREAANAAISACHVGCLTCPNTEAQPQQAVADIDFIGIDQAEVIVAKADRGESEHIEPGIRNVLITLAAAQ